MFGIRRRLKSAWGWADNLIKRQVVAATTKHVSGPNSIATQPSDVVLICLVRDGLSYIDAFLAHYRELGIRHFVFMDNGSVDGTLERLSREKDVTLLRSSLRYKFYKYNLKDFMLRTYGKANWVLCVDIDELFDFPFRGGQQISRLTEYLQKNDFNAVAAQLLDMFPDRSILTRSDESWRNTHRFYDITNLESSPYTKETLYGSVPPNPAIKLLHGGVRLDHFGSRNFLTKHPLVFPPGGARIKLDHYAMNARIADVSCVLLHYKFVGDFISYFQMAVREGSFWNGSVEYANYLDKLAGAESLVLYKPTAKQYDRPEDLCESGFLVAPERYDRFMRQRSNP